MSPHEELYNSIAANVCNKPNTLTAEDCFSQTTNPLCRNHKACRLFEKSLEQLKYVQQLITEDTFLRACPGSGKTEVVGLKAAHEIKSWPHSNKGIAVLTFTNNAANEIAERITQFTGSSGTAYPHYVGTIDSWLHGYIANPFAHLLTGYAGKDSDRSLRLVSNGHVGGWLSSYRCKTQYYRLKDEELTTSPIYANTYYYDPECKSFFIMPPFSNMANFLTDRDVYDSEAFEKFRQIDNKDWLTLEVFQKGLWTTKKDFWKAGFATFQDVELITWRLLTKNGLTISEKLAERFPFIIIDECQDLSWIQLSVLESLQNQGATLHFVGDLNQGIYSFKKVFPLKVKEFVDNKGFTEMPLNENYRSVQTIVNVCGKLCNQGTIVGRSSNGAPQLSCVLFTYPDDCQSELPQKFSDYLSANGLDNRNSVILARGKSLISRLRAGLNESSLTRAELPTQAIFLWKTGDWERQKTALQYMGKYIATTYFSDSPMDSKNQYCPDTIKSKIQWRVFLAAILKTCIQTSELVDVNKTWGQWSKPFKENFPGIVSAAANKHELELEVTEWAYRSPSGKASTKLEDYMEGVSNSSETSAVRITLIHQVKGETHDATLLVSSPDRKGGSGGHWSEWLDSTRDDGEHSRFAYVASSRPKYLLAWAIPETDTDGVKMLQELGFELQ